MEAAVTRVQLLFQKTDSDLDFIQRKLEFEIMKGFPDGLSQEENPLVLIQQLSVMKSRYKMLHQKLGKISLERQETMHSICVTLDKTMKLVQEIQQSAGMEISPLPEEEQLAVQQLMSRTLKVTDDTTKQYCLKEHGS